VKTIRRIFLLLPFLLLCSPASRATNFQTLLPRPPVLPGNAYRLPEKTEIGRIVIKFQEGTHVRLRISGWPCWSGTTENGRRSER
jgi:hypothetical protein